MRFYYLYFLSFGLNGVYYCNEKYEGKDIAVRISASDQGDDDDTML